MVNSCENCGINVDASYPNDPEIGGVIVCSEDCADELRPLPPGFAFVVGGDDA